MGLSSGQAFAFILALTVAGCAIDGTSHALGDCSAQVRSAGVTYTAYGYTEREAHPYSLADVADCRDSGEDAEGSVFSEHPERVTTWSFAGYEPEEVLGVRFDANTFAVFVADTLPEAERDHIFRDLRRG